MNQLQRCLTNTALSNLGQKILLTFSTCLTDVTMLKGLFWASFK